MALVTGSGRGIGLGIAQALASAGCAVALQDIDADVASTEVDRIKAAGGKAAALGGDITNLSLPKQLIDQTIARLGGLHILINNAAIQKESDWLEITPEDMREKYQANVIVPLMLCQLAVPIFRAQRWGRIINLGSIQQIKGNTGMLSYSVTKAALKNMTTALARALARDGITVNMIAPGYFNTYRNRFDLKTPQDLAERGKRVVPVGRIGEPKDCAGAALLLCSEAGGYMTGQTLHIDGGMSS